VVLDDDPIELLVRSLGRRTHGALWIRPTGGVAIALVALPEDGTDVADLAKRIAVLPRPTSGSGCSRCRACPPWISAATRSFSATA
jgi:hypothetical protein